MSAFLMTYLGDAEIGARTNIGAGTITCNYDGFNKHITKIGQDTFVGSNSTLVAPLNIGDEAMVAAGSVVNRDVPDGAMTIGRGKQEIKEEWFKTWRKRKLEQQSTEKGR
ncbi:MAG: DapH/DapD/GlmU-related protein [Fimbriimonadaceae bacterium]